MSPIGGSWSSSIRLVVSGIIVGEESGAGSPTIGGREYLSPPDVPGNDSVEEGAFAPSTVLGKIDIMSTSDEELTGFGAIFFNFLGTGWLLGPPGAGT